VKGAEMSQTRHGRRRTRQQHAIVRALRDSATFVSAQDLHAAMRRSGDRIGLATVYRGLQALVADGEVDMLRSHDNETLYRSCSDTHHHHLVCRGCGRTEEVSGGDVEDWAARQAKTFGFADVSHTVELHGVCGACAGNGWPS
jgi:Fur family ferric uptake transcriptional regulator